MSKNTPVMHLFPLHEYCNMLTLSLLFAESNALPFLENVTLLVTFSQVLSYCQKFLISITDRNSPETEMNILSNTTFRDGQTREKPKSQRRRMIDETC